MTFICLRSTTPIELSCAFRSEEHTSELQSRLHLECRLLLQKNKAHQRRGRGSPRPSSRHNGADRAPPHAAFDPLQLAYTTYPSSSVPGRRARPPSDPSLLSH